MYFFTKKKPDIVWDFGDGGTSKLPDPSHKWDLAGGIQNATYSVTATITDVSGEKEVSRSKSVNVVVMPTPTATARRSLDNIPELQGKIEGDYDIRNVSVGTDSLELALVGIENSTYEYDVIDLTNGLFNKRGDTPYICNKSGVIILGNSILRGDMLEDNWLPYDADGSSESSIIKGQIVFTGDNCAIYDVIFKPKILGEGDSGAQTLIGFTGEGSRFVGCYWDRAGDNNITLSENVNLFTVESCRLNLFPGFRGVLVKTGTTTEPKYGLVFDNCYFEQEGYTGQALVIGQQTGEPESVAIRAENPVTIIGGVYNLPWVMEVTQTSGDYRFVNRYADVTGVQSIGQIASKIRVPGVGGGGISLAEKLGYSSDDLGTKTKTALVYGDEYQEIIVGGERIDITGMLQRRGVTGIEDSNWELYE